MIPDKSFKQFFQKVDSSEFNDKGNELHLVGRRTTETVFGSCYVLFIFNNKEKYSLILVIQWVNVMMNLQDTSITYY